MSKIIPKSVNIKNMISFIRAEAAKKREAAALDGRHDDGGARELETQVKFFNYGWDAANQPWSAALPTEWNEFAIHLDPEYEQYQKLKKKFGDR